MSHYSVKFRCHRHCDIGDLMVIVLHVVKESYGSMGRSPSRQFIILPRLLVAIGILGRHAFSLSCDLPRLRDQRLL